MVLGGKEVQQAGLEGPMGSTGSRNWTHLHPSQLHPLPSAHPQCQGLTQGWGVASVSEGLGDEVWPQGEP